MSEKEAHENIGSKFGAEALFSLPPSLSVSVPVSPLTIRASDQTNGRANLTNKENNGLDLTQPW
ncbi:unnamed protein product [Fusarium graminearum]|uniref:Chromosome 2, complete genome n=1 Tax=Gibberella zeae (strain ATCC MYA-4620 / CBS 123657 / FGSC 9075 / NRRL 31084 / PH-1) TaxID=229533 RepID=A0A098DDX3_GIBZE|nr:unnamed protein product [Fusarium graminearum]CZS80449.1 unnamed protein product [Fusarium graminearum]